MSVLRYANIPYLIGFVVRSQSHQISRRFKKDLDKINDQKFLSKVGKCIEAIGTSQAQSEIPELESLKGLLGYYRIKFDYS
ncbi:MAG: hypothetical protein IM470_04655 [Microcystis sp. M158S2]|nr:hypothetical protein [Microcystis sp. M158S2]